MTVSLQRHCPDVVHQRCQVHYLRNALAKVTTPARQQELLAGLRDVWAAPTRAVATQRGAALAATLRPTLPAVAEWLDETLADTLGFYALPEAEARRRLRTTAPKPFVWTKSADDILASVTRFCRRTSGSDHEEAS